MGKRKSLEILNVNGKLGSYLSVSIAFTGASIVLIQFLGALKVVPLTNLLVRPKAGSPPMTDPSWE